MCETTSRILFCTCEIEDHDYPDEYWILHRFVDGKDEIIIGSPMMPVDITVSYEDLEGELCRRLNEPDCFDKPISFETKDVLVVRLNGFEKEFSFQFNGQDWNPARDMDDVELMSAYKEIKEGCISKNWRQVIGLIPPSEDE